MWSVPALCVVLCERPWGSLEVPRKLTLQDPWSESPTAGIEAQKCFLLRLPGSLLNP